MSESNALCIEILNEIIAANNSLEATGDPVKLDERCGAICMGWSEFAILEGKSRGEPRRLSSRPLGRKG